MKYKIGDKVRIRRDLIVDEYYGKEHFMLEMAKFRGKIVTIRNSFYIGDNYALYFIKRF